MQQITMWLVEHTVDSFKNGGKKEGNPGLTPNQNLSLLHKSPVFDPLIHQGHPLLTSTHILTVCNFGYVIMNLTY